MTPDEWMEAGKEVVYSRGEMEQYIDDTCGASQVPEIIVAVETDMPPLPWMPVEELVVPLKPRPVTGVVWEYMRPFMLLAALVSMVVGLVQTGMTTVDSCRDNDISKYHV
jgi:hypothetical protein